jgi:hypothetical protein
VIRLFLALIWGTLATLFYIYVHLPATQPEQRSQLEMFVWFGFAAAFYNFIRWCVAVGTALQRRRFEDRQRREDLQRQLTKPKGPVVNPEFQVDDGGDQGIRLRDVE